MNEMSDIVDRLKAYAECNANGLYIEANCVYDAIETIERLRSALHSIGFDYVELSHDKVQHLYLKHINVARLAYQSSFPEENKKSIGIPLDDNF